jgi:transcriptional regulator with XRE-family HTH domain
MTGAQLRRLRAKAGLSQATLAALMGLTVRSISAYETAASPIPKRTAIGLRALLGAASARPPLAGAAPEEA